jgi:hypothetical protein
VIRKGGDGQALEIINNMHRAVQLGHLCSLYQAHTLQIPTHVLGFSHGSLTWVSVVSGHRIHLVADACAARDALQAFPPSLSPHPPPPIPSTHAAGQPDARAAQDAMQAFTSEPAAAASDNVALSMKTSRKTFPSCAQGIEVSPFFWSGSQ